jgi:hypothetical protein
MRDEGELELEKSLFMTEFEVIRLAVKIKPENMLAYKISMD